MNEPWIDKILRFIPHKGRRVLVPARLVEHFEGVIRQGGSTLKVPLRSVVQQLARAKVGVMYRPQTVPSTAPKSYSCSTLTYWVYAFVGISLPRYAIDQADVGKPVKKPVAGGLAFYENRFPIRDNGRAIGHVGITTKQGTLVHGSTKENRIVEVPLLEGAVLYTDPILNEPQRLIIVPPKIEGVFTALDLSRWLERPLRF